MSSGALAKEEANAPHPLDVAIGDDAAPHLAALYRTEDIAIAPDGRRAMIEQSTIWRASKPLRDVLDRFRRR